MNTEKRAINEDIFTTAVEAVARSWEIGLEGRIHTHEHNDQAVYMPGATHEEYMANARLQAEMFSAGITVKKAEYQGRTVSLDKPFRLESGASKKFGVYVKDGDSVKRVTFGDPDMEIRRDNPEARRNFRSRHSCDTATDKTSARYWSCRMWEAGTTVSEMTKEETVNKSYDFEVLKRDDEQRIVWGWAYISTVDGELQVDTQGDSIEPQEMVLMANEFMKGARHAKAMHTGEARGEIVHSFPMTKELSQRFGIETNKEGWIIGMHVADDEAWEATKSDDFKGFSIGGRATVREAY